MANWYWRENGEHRGPVSSKELIALVAAGKVARDTLVYKDGAAEWAPAALVKGLFDTQPPPIAPPQKPADSIPPKDGDILAATRRRASLFIRDFRSLNWREEVVPIDATNVQDLLRDYVFWTVLVIGVLPQLIGTVENVRAQLSLYAMLFAAVWGIAFRDLIVRAPAKWSWLIASAVFTGTIGLWFLKCLAAMLPEQYIAMSRSPSILVSLAGFVLQTGVMEELCKAIPVLAYLILKRNDAKPLTAILIGVFSGLGFAAFENLFYGESAIVFSFYKAQLHNSLHNPQEVLDSGTLTVLLRSLSSVLGHAILTGIVAYFLVLASLAKRRALILTPIGIGLAAVLHGCYDWLLRLQPTFAALIDVVAFILFYGYVNKLKTLIATGQADAQTTDQEEVETPRNGNAF